MTVPRADGSRTLLGRQEVQGALLVGGIAFLLSLARTLHEPGWPTDFDQWYHAARAMLHGGNPYEAVGPARPFKWDWPLNYPVPTVLLVMPLTLLPMAAARVCFSAAAGGVLGYALGKDRFRRVGLLLSAAFVIAISRNQWSPFITASFFVPLAAIFLAAKPNMALAFVAGAPSWRQLRWIIGVGLVVGLVSVVARPSWPVEWFDTLSRMQYVVAPIMRPGGILYLLALLRWRRPEARVFLALVCVPQTPSLYDLLPLYVVTRSHRQVALLSLLTNVVFLTIVALGPFPSFDQYAYRLGYISTFLVYLPVLAMLLWRPNVFHDTPEHDAPDRLTPGHDSISEPAGFRASIQAMPRLDAILLLVNITATVLLVGLALTTRRM